MTVPLTRDDVAKVARLARLHLSEDELEMFTLQLGQVLEHAADIAALDLSDVVPTTHPFALVNVVRADVVTEGLDRDEVLAVAPDVDDGRFAVPSILGQTP